MREYAKYEPDENIISKHNDPLISVCVAVYNSRDYLPRSIDSILAQTYTNLEIILCDDGSTDGSQDICDEYAGRDERIRVIHKANGGLYTTRNTGIEAARGDYICFLDGDDYIDPDMYRVMLCALLNEDADICIDRYRLVFTDGSVRDLSSDKVIVFEGREVLKQFLKEDEAVLIQNCAWNKLYRRSLIGDLRFPARWYEDMLYTPSLLAKCEKSVYIDRAYHNYICDRSSSIMNMGVNPRVFTDLIPNLYDRAAYLRSIGCEELALLSEYRMYKKLLDLFEEISGSDDPDKRKHLKQLDDMIRADASRMDEIYGAESARASDLRKMKIYLKSPSMYMLTMRINRDIRLPLMQRAHDRSGS